MNKTWFIDFDGTLVLQKSHLLSKDYILPGVVYFFNNIIKKDDFVIITTARKGNEHKSRIENFLKTNKLRFNLVLCDIPAGPRIIINDTKPDGTITAVALPVERDIGLENILESM